jgi:hypothetical protein
LDPEHYGVLRPRDGLNISVKSVSCDAALLLLTLPEASPLPQYVLDRLGSRCETEIARMVLDGILEIELGNRMISGPEALQLVSPDRASAGFRNALSELSLHALQYAAELSISEPATLAQRLYAYNRIPTSQRWLRFLPDAASVRDFLGVERHKVAGALDTTWSSLPADDRAPWTVWRSKRRDSGGPFEETFKLYVSPACNELPEVFAETAVALAPSRSFQWKVGRSLRGLLRPDKIVAYFRRFNDLQETAARLIANLSGCPPHGVPFTAEIAGAGLVSWGLDPPRDERTVSWLSQTSWRSRICNRLGASLALYKTAPDSGVSAAAFAAERLRLEGIDPDTWAPAS